MTGRRLRNKRLMSRDNPKTTQTPSRMRRDGASIFLINISPQQGHDWILSSFTQTHIQNDRFLPLLSLSGHQNQAVNRLVYESDRISASDCKDLL